MAFPLWLRSRATARDPGPAPRHRRRAASRSVTTRSWPRLEVLEDRAVPATFNVTMFGDVVTPGDGALSLREAIIEADALPGADTITLPAGTYTLALAGPGEDAAATGDLDITDDLTITGAGSASTVVDARFDFFDRVFHVHASANVTLANLAITNGNSLEDVGGGGILNAGTLTVAHCTLFRNRAVFGDGGGIANAGTLTITGSTLSENGARTGGGIANAIGATATIVASSFSSNFALLGSGGLDGAGGGLFNLGSMAVTDSVFSSNRAAFGSGIVNGGGMTVRTSSFSRNLTGGSGGGIVNLVGGTLDLGGSNLSRNTGYEGGGIANEGTMTIANSTLSENSATLRGGGIYNAGTMTVTASGLSGNVAPDGGGIYNAGTMTVTASELSGNIALNYGGGIYNTADAFGAGVLVVLDSNLHDNRATYYGGGIYNQGYDGIKNNSRLIVRGSILTGNSADRGGGLYNSFDALAIILDASAVIGNFASLGADIANIDKLVVANSTVGDIFPKR